MRRRWLQGIGIVVAVGLLTGLLLRAALKVTVGLDGDVPIGPVAFAVLGAAGLIAVFLWLLLRRDGSGEPEKEAKSVEVAPDHNPGT